MTKFEFRMANEKGDHTLSFIRHSPFEFRRSATLPRFPAKPENGGMNIHGIGTDIIECLRIAAMIEKHGELFLSRVYTPHEIEYCSARRAANQRYAGRFAAKEAVLKALGTGWTRGIQWQDIEVRNELGGKPRIALSGGARELCIKTGISEVLITISHCRSFATAYAIAVGKE